MGDQIYRHSLNKGGLEDILSKQRLMATEARGVAGGASAVRAMNGPWHLPYKGQTPGIEFTASVKGHPTRWGGMEGTAWHMDEGKFLEIKVTKVVYPDGRVVTYEPKTLPAKPAPLPVQKQAPPPVKPEVPTGKPQGGGRVIMDRAKAGFKAGFKSYFSAGALIQLAADLFLAYADKVAAEEAIKRLQIFFIKEGVAKGVAAAVMRWSEEEVAAEAMNRVTDFRVQGFFDAAGLLTLTQLFKIATQYENYSVGYGYFWASQQSDAWKKEILAKGTKRLYEAGYDHRRKDESYFFEYEYLARLSWALRQHTDLIVDRAMI